MAKDTTVAEYDEVHHQIYVTSSTRELHEVARSIPGAIEQRSRGRWRIPATPSSLGRLLLAYEEYGITIDPALRRYRDAVSLAARMSHLSLSAPPQPIPRTNIQPVGEWMHQRKAFWFAEPLEAAMLAITMGGGKTKISIDLLQHWEAKRTLIISPLPGIEDAWMPGLKKHMYLPYEVLDLSTGGVAKKTDKAELFFREESSVRIAVINHESYWREPFASWASDRRWDLVICDESHRSKSAGSKNSKYLNRIGMRSRRRLALTGTPMPHSPLDLYGQFRFLDRGIFGTSFEEFMAEYAILQPGYMGRPEPTGKFKNLDELNRKFHSIAIQIDDSEQGLPKLVHMPYTYVKLEPKARKAYDELDEEYTTEVAGGEITAANAGVKFMRLQQIASGNVMVGKEYKVISTAKIDALRVLLQEEIPHNEPVVVFCRFIPELDAICDLCTELGIEWSQMSGKINSLRDWKAGETRVLVAQIQTIKESVDATRAAYGVFYSTGISLGDYEQCLKRLHRPPQSRMVRFFHILAKATRDIDTMRALRMRKDVITEALRVRGKAAQTLEDIPSESKRKR